jgi:octaprenyl-diphosphate synthase
MFVMPTPTAPTSPLAFLTDLVADDLAAVNALMLAHLNTDAPLIAEVASHLLLAGGKRLRPMLTLASAKLCGYDGAHHIPLAASVEFIHAATLLHDDVVDGSPLRRGLQSAQDLWGNSASVLVGDYLFTQSFQLMLAAQSLEVLNVLSNAAATIAKGEVMQLAGSHRLETTRADYLQVIHAKTAALFAAACEIGGLVAGAPADQVVALQRYGAAIGMAFQLIDDVLDYTDASQDFGKAAGHDFAEGKMTLPLIVAVEAATADTLPFWQRTLQEDTPNLAEDLVQATQLIEAADGFAITRALAKDYVNQAQQALTALPRNAHHQALTQLCDFCLTRNF